MVSTVSLNEIRDGSADLIGSRWDEFGSVPMQCIAMHCNAMLLLYKAMGDDQKKLVANEILRPGNMKSEPRLNVE